MTENEVKEILRIVANGDEAVVKPEDLLDVCAAAPKYNIKLGQGITEDFTGYRVFSLTYHPQIWLDDIHRIVCQLVKARQFAYHEGIEVPLPPGYAELFSKLESLVCDWEALWHEVQERGKDLRERKNLREIKGEVLLTSR